MLKDFVAAGAKGAEIGSRLDAIVEVSDRIPDIGFKKVTVRCVAIVQIECGDHDHDDVPVFFIAALVRIEFSAIRVTRLLSLRVKFDLGLIFAGYRPWFAFAVQGGPAQRGVPDKS